MSGDEEPSRAAGGCVLVVLGAAVVAALYAVDEAAGTLMVVAAGTFALWRSASRLSVSSATPPPGGSAPLDDEEAGHSVGDGTTLVRREGMLIYLTPDADNPVRTRVRVERAAPGDDEGEVTPG
ncbi:hypothetical protein [Streptomyces sp. bgisy154]|uniref:hypothetical protein n=1 Tax=Streptomyces sp. bgisy154 TaxID=3413794 RepID=UPI003D764F26